jgi:hypothetical protein
MELSLPLYVRCVGVVMRWHLLAILVSFALNLSLYKAGVTRYNRELTDFEMLHYSVVTHFTVGYGDVYPTNPPAQALSWLNMGAFFVLAASQCDLKGVE